MRSVRLLAASLALALSASLAAAHARECKSDERCGNIVFDGDSISAGVGARAGKPDQLLEKSLPMPVRVDNVAKGGRPVATCLLLFDRLVAQKYRPGAAFNVIVFHAGDNDIAQDADAATTYLNFTRYIRKAAQLGWLVVVSTELPRPKFPPQKQDQLAAYNRMLVGNRAGADAVVDLAAAFPALNDPRNRHDSPLYSPDEVHPNDTGYAQLNALLDAAVRSVVTRR